MNQCKFFLIGNITALSTFQNEILKTENKIIYKIHTHTCIQRDSAAKKLEQKKKTRVKRKKKNVYK